VRVTRVNFIRKKPHLFNRISAYINLSFALTEEALGLMCIFKLNFKIDQHWFLLLRDRCLVAVVSQQL